MTLRLKQSAHARQLAISGFAGKNGNTADRSIATLQQAFIIFSISVVLLLALMFAMPDVATQIKNSLIGEADAPALIAGDALSLDADAPDLADGLPSAAHPKRLTGAEAAAAGAKHQQQWVTSWLSRRYRVANDATDMLVATAYTTAKDIKLDPLLILAVMAIESGLNPFAESPVGAKGLMQVMASVHRERFQGLGGVQAALNPVANIKVGSAILKEYVTRGGSVEAGLKSYVGAGAFEHDDGYGSRVMTEYSRLKQVAVGKNVPISFPVRRASVPAIGHPKTVDTAEADNNKTDLVVAL